MLGLLLGVSKAAFGLQHSLTSCSSQTLYLTIVQPMFVPPWNIHELIDRKQGAISLFLSNHRYCSKKARIKFDRALDHLIQMPKQKWERPHSSPLGDNTYVIRFTDETRKQLRVFGYFQDDHHCFVMTLTGEEKDDQYSPKDYEKILLEHRKFISKNFLQHSKPFEERCFFPICQQGI